VGDRLLFIDDHAVKTFSSLVREIYKAGVWSKAAYELDRNNVKVEVPVILAQADKSLNQGLRLIALIYLGVGIYVLLRRWTAPKSTHFYIFCLVSFISYSFRYIGKFNSFDWMIYWSNIAAGVLQPALFLHFALIFPDKKKFLQGKAWLLSLV